MSSPSNWRELAGLASTPELFASSPLAHRMVFVMTPDHRMGRLLASALAELPDFDPIVRHTGVLTDGIPRLIGNYGVTKHAGRVGGLSALTTDSRFLQATRALTDDLIAPDATASTLIVEYSPGHGGQLLLADLLYPDATFVRITGAVRRRALMAGLRARGSIGTRAGAVRRWLRADAAFADASRHLAEPSKVHQVVAHAVARSPAVVARGIAAQITSRSVSAPPRTTGPDPSLEDRVIFVLGCFRSGTTWLEHLLLAHPALCGLDGRESWVFEGLADLWRNIVEGPLATSLGPGGGVRAERRYVDSLLGGFRDHNHPGATHVVEKSPVHTAHLRQLAAVYPDAWFVSIVRDGRDVVRSLMEVDDDADAASASRMWHQAVSDVHRAAPKLSRFREVRYEALVADPVGHATSLLTWMGLGVDDAVRSELSQRAAHHVSRRNTQGPPGSGKWREELTHEQLETIDGIAGVELRSLGYT